MANLRGTIVAYLETHGWRWDADAEAWILLGTDTRFYGSHATDHAIHYQIETEEGRQRIEAATAAPGELR